MKLKYLKIKYFISGLRILLCKIKNTNKIKFIGLKHFFGKNVSVDISSKGEVLFEGVYLSRNTDLIAQGGIIKIGKDTFFNKNNLIVSLESINIGSNCLFGDNVSIFDHDHNFDSIEKTINKQGFKTNAIVIGDNVWVGSKSTILKGVTIGSNTIIGCNSTVNKDIPANCIAVGSPAKVIRYRD